MNDSIELHVPEDGLQAPPRQEKGWRVDPAEERLGGKGHSSHLVQVIREKSSKIVSYCVSVVDRPSWFDGPSRTRGSDCHLSHSDERGHRDHHQGSSRRHESPRAESARRHSPRCHESGEQTRPSSSSGRSRSRSRHGADSMDHPGSAHASSRATDSRAYHHHSRAAVDHRSLPTQHRSRRHDKDSTDHPGSTHVSRKEIDLTTTVPDQPARRIITVIRSTSRPAYEDILAGSTGPAEVAHTARGDGSARPVDSAVVDDPAEGDDSERVADSAAVDGPARTANSARVADPQDRGFQQL